MGGGENTQEHRKVEAVGVGWESMPSPHLRACDQAPGEGGDHLPRQGRVGELQPRNRLPRVRWYAHRGCCVPESQASWTCQPQGCPVSLREDLSPRALVHALVSPPSPWVSVLFSVKSGLGWWSLELIITNTLVSWLKCRIQPQPLPPPTRGAYPLPTPPFILNHSPRSSQYEHGLLGHPHPRQVGQPL